MRQVLSSLAGDIVDKTKIIKIKEGMKKKEKMSANVFDIKVVVDEVCCRIGEK